MSRIAYVNGRYVRHSQAAVHIEDRGYQFGDAVYEVWSVQDGRLKDEAGHFARLERSLGEIRIVPPLSADALRIIIRRLLKLNRVSTGLVYLQVSRGVARRDHAFPKIPTEPSVVLTTKRVNLDATNARAAEGVSVVSVPDERWGRCDIKTTNLLPNVLAKQAAAEAGAAEAWQIDAEGRVTEGSSSNAWIVTSDGVLVTRQADHAILRGITRTTVLQCAAELGYPVEERAFSLKEALAAREAFMTSASSFVTPVVSIDGKTIANGAPGSMAIALRQAYIDVN